MMRRPLFIMRMISIPYAQRLSLHPSSAIAYGNEWRIVAVCTAVEHMARATTVSAPKQLVLSMACRQLPAGRSRDSCVSFCVQYDNYKCCTTVHGILCELGDGEWRCWELVLTVVVAFLEEISASLLLLHCSAGCKLRLLSCIGLHCAL